MSALLKLQTEKYSVLPYTTIEKIFVLNYFSFTEIKYLSNAKMHSLRGWECFVIQRSYKVAMPVSDSLV